MLEKSLRAYGAGRSILLDKHGRIIAGNKTVQVAAEIGMDDLVIVETDGSQMVAVKRNDLDLETDDDARALAYADNRVAEVDLDFDPLQLVMDRDAGKLPDFWTDDEIAELISADAEQLDPADDPGPDIDAADELQKKWQTETGQVWEIENHRLMCGDFLDFLSNVPSNATLFYDPPWDSNTILEYKTESVLAFTDGQRLGGVVDLFGSPTWIFAWDCQSCWYTPNRPLKRAKYAAWYGNIDDYKYEGAFYGDVATAKAVSNSRGTYDYKPDPRGKHLADIYAEPITKLHAKGLHNHEKPETWVRLLVGNCSLSTLYDPFCGLGASLSACIQNGIQFFGSEIEPKYCAVVLERMQGMGLTPRLEGAAIQCGV